MEKALREVGSSLDRITAIFVTHEHVDHTRGLEVISKKHHIPTHMTEPSARALITDPHASLLGDLYLHPLLFSVRLGNTTVRSFATPHDSAASVGYTISYTEENGVTEKLGVATDIGHIDDSIVSSLIGADSVILEANHDVEMLLSGPYPYPLKRRILSDTGHLSNDMVGGACKAACRKRNKAFSARSPVKGKQLSADGGSGCPRGTGGFFRHNGRGGKPRHTDKAKVAPSAHSFSDIYPACL